MANASKTAELVEFEGSQIVKIPDEFRFTETQVVIRQAGDALIIEPARPQNWPPGFFEEIWVKDPAFVRPEQGPLPPAPSFD